MYSWDSRNGLTFSLGLHTTVFQAEIYTTKVCVVDDTEECYAGRNIYIFSDSQAAFKALDNFRINSKLVWDCLQSLLKLGEHKRIWYGCQGTWKLMEMK
jgi:hypothetical protein